MERAYFCCLLCTPLFKTIVHQIMTDISQYAFLKQLADIPAIDAIWLYGSRACGDAKERSDIDIALVSFAVNDALRAEVDTIIEEQSDTLLAIDCVWFEDLELNAPLRLRILQDKVVLFERRVLQTDLWQQQLKDLGEAIERLKESLEAPVDIKRFIIDAAIQRFEFSIELFWKNFKNLAELQGKEVLSPRQAVVEAYKMRWCDNEQLWLNMLRDRDATSHTYKKYKADEVYARIHLYYPEMQLTYQRLLAVAEALKKETL